MSRASIVLGALLVALALPAAAFAETAGERPTGPQPVVVTPDCGSCLLRTAPPSTAPDDAPAPVVLGLTAFRGTVLHGEGDLLLVDASGAQMVVRLPSTSLLTGEAIPAGTPVEGVGPSSTNGVFQALALTLWP